LLVLLPLLANVARAQTPDDITQLVNRVIELDSIDVAKEVKFRAGLEPALFTLEAGPERHRRDPRGRPHRPAEAPAQRLAGARALA
jgi:hypothetical protein